MNFTIKKNATYPVDGRTYDLERASVWAVDLSRGDLFVLAFEIQDVLVVLTEAGFGCEARQLMNVPMDIMVDHSNDYLKVIALPSGDGETWLPCRRLHVR